MPDRTLQAQKLEEKGFGVGFQTISVVYNGREMTKAELIAYFYELTRLQREIEELPKKAQSLSNQMESLKLQKRRKEFTMPQMEPPKGLAALSSRRKREYQRWLDDAPKREEEDEKKKGRRGRKTGGSQSQK
ncbi:MAG: hypothetical protein LUG55_12035 [Clostridiales bacterium]|nr:hypothetical protein [Clostridiales bacterium]